MTMRRALARILRLSFFIALPVVLFYLTTVWYVIDRSGGTKGFTSAECGIVFGTAIRPIYNEEGKIISYTAGPGIDRRVRAAADLFAEGRIKKVFLSGGKGEGSPQSEAHVMQRWAEELGIPSDVITVEEESRSTWENLEFTRPLTSGCQSVVAISDGYHLARIALQAHMQGWEIQTYTAEQPVVGAFIVQNWLREALGIDWLVVVQLLT
jgi:vancomycin permeability regulator SanA